MTSNMRLFFIKYPTVCYITFVNGPTLEERIWCRVVSKSSARPGKVSRVLYGIAFATKTLEKPPKLHSCNTYISGLPKLGMI